MISFFWLFVVSAVAGAGLGRWSGGLRTLFVVVLLFFLLASGNGMRRGWRAARCHDDAVVHAGLAGRLVALHRQRRQWRRRRRAPAAGRVLRPNGGPRPRTKPAGSRWLTRLRFALPKTISLTSGSWPRQGVVWTSKGFLRNDFFFSTTLNRFFSCYRILSEPQVPWSGGSWPH